MDDNIGKATLDSDMHFCALHPQRDTELRCNRCDRYMCIDCAKRTPVGYTCRECVRGHENKFYQGTLIDYALVAAVSALGGALTVLLTSLVGGFLIIGFIVAPAIGGSTAQVALQITGRRRGRHSGTVSAGGLVLGGLAAAFFLTGTVGLFTLIYLGLAASAAFARFKMTI